MLTTAPRVYGVTDPAEAMRMSGREFLEAIIDGRLPAPPMARTLSFLLDRGRRRLRRLRGRRRGASSEPARGRPRRLGADPDRQRDRLRRADDPARRRQLHLDRDQGQFLPRDHQGHGPGPRRRPRRRPWPAHHLLRGADRRRAAAASWRMGHRRSWSWQAKSRQLLLEVRTLW